MLLNAVYLLKKTWHCWMIAKNNGCSDIKGFLLPMMRNIAKSLTVDAFDKALLALKTSEWWIAKERQNFVQYFTQYWLEKKEV